MNGEAAHPSADIVARVERLLGARVQAWSRVVGGGYTPAARWIARLDLGSVFVKIATNAVTIGMLRFEAAIYEAARGPFMARYHGWDDDETSPLLIIEDLSRASWPPPWTRGRYEAARTAIAAMHATDAAVPTYAERLDQHIVGWPLVARDPAPFLALGFADARWLEQNLPTLIRAEAACERTGDALIHFDLRSDNLCIIETGAAPAAKIVDWAAACRGNAMLDLGGWCPSLAYEGGPAPEEVVGHQPEIAALISGYFAARAGLPIIPSAPRVREVQHAQLTAALPWVTRALGLTAP